MSNGYSSGGVPDDFFQLPEVMRLRDNAMITYMTSDEIHYQIGQIARQFSDAEKFGDMACEISVIIWPKTGGWSGVPGNYKATDFRELIHEGRCAFRFLNPEAGEAALRERVKELGLPEPIRLEFAK